MTKEALKLALEALEGADNIDVDMQAAIVKCKEALAQPVQPERQPLTDEEMDLICEKALFCKISFQQFGRSIEAAHNIGAKP